MNTARRRNRSIWEVLEELERQPGILRLSPETRAAASRLVVDLRRYIELANERPAGEVLYAFLRGSGWLARLAAADTVAAEEALSNVARFFDIVRAQSALLADDRAVFVARHLNTLIQAGDDPPTADIDPDVDAVAVMTLHKAKGLEFPVVYMPGLVTGRFPATGRREPLGLPLELVHETLPEGDYQLQEERRLFYVGMTRARDELVLSHAADYGGQRARRVSPFVLEALDLPVAAGTPGAGARSTTPLERLAGLERTEAAPVPRRAHGDEPLVLSFYAVDDYLTCPLKYKYAHLLRVPLAPHHSLIYGSALHAAVAEFHRRHARGEVMSEEQLYASFEDAWTNDGFLSREHEEARLAAGRDALRRFREEQLAPGAVTPAYVEREFSFLLDGDRVRGRMDRVDIVARDPSDPVPVMADDAGTGADVIEPMLGLAPERVVITDYKSSDVRDPAKARQRARDSLQLSIYAMGYEATTGRLPDAVALHFLETGLVGTAPVDRRRIDKAKASIRTAAAGIRARDFEAKPDRLSCSWCPFREICPSSAVTLTVGSTSDAAGVPIVAITLDFGNTLVPVPAAGLRDVVGRTAGAMADRLGPFDVDEVRRIWAEERERQFREEVPQFREVDLGERIVRVLARLRGMAPPPPDGPLGRRGREAARGSRRDGLDDRGLLARVRRRAAAAGRSRGAPRSPRRALPARDPVQLAAGGHDRPLRGGGGLDAVPRRDRRLPAGRDDQAAPGDLRGGEACARRSRTGFHPPRGRRLGGGRRRCATGRLARRVRPRASRRFAPAGERARRSHRPGPGPRDRGSRGARGRPGAARRGLSGTAGPPGGRPPSVDSVAMERRDRLANLGLLAAAVVAWVLVAILVTTRDPYADPMAGYVGALLIGLAVGVTAIPLCWLIVFARHRRIAYEGDWFRAARRGGWVGLFVAAIVVLRLVGAFQPAIVVFLAAIFIVAEITLSAER